jgi:hypothetical protein
MAERLNTSTPPVRRWSPTTSLSSFSVGVTLTVTVTQGAEPPGTGCQRAWTEKT